MSVKVRINRIYRGIEYSIELDVYQIRTVKKVGILMEKTERFIDSMLDAVPYNETMVR